VQGTNNLWWEGQQKEIQEETKHHVGRRDGEHHVSQASALPCPVASNAPVEGEGGSTCRGG